MFRPKAPLLSVSLPVLMAAIAPAVLGDPSEGGGQGQASPVYASEVPQEERKFDNAVPLDLTTDKTAIPVAQEIEFILHSRFLKDGGFDAALKTVAHIDYYGTRYVDCAQYPLEVHTAPDQISVLVDTGDASRFKSSRSSEDIAILGTPQGLNNEQERALLLTYDFHTPIADLEKNKDAFEPLGVQKLSGVLAWKLETRQAGHYRQIVYLDTHYGDIVKATIVDVQGAPILNILKHDYRLVDGIRVPYAIDYKMPDGTVLANDRIQRVEVKQTTIP